MPPKQNQPCELSYPFSAVTAHTEHSAWVAAGVGLLQWRRGPRATLWVLCPCSHTAWRSTPPWITPLAVVSAGPPVTATSLLSTLRLLETTIGGNPSKALSTTKEVMGSFPLCFPLGLALGSPIFPSGCEGKLGVALESMQGRRDLKPKN